MGCGVLYAGKYFRGNWLRIWENCSGGNNGLRLFPCSRSDLASLRTYHRRPVSGDRRDGTGHCVCLRAVERSFRSVQNPSHLWDIQQTDRTASACSEKTLRKTESADGWNQPCPSWYAATSPGAGCPSGTETVWGNADVSLSVYKGVSGEAYISDLL